MVREPADKVGEALDAELDLLERPQVDVGVAQDLLDVLDLERVVRRPAGAAEVLHVPGGDVEGGGGAAGGDGLRQRRNGEEREEEDERAHGGGGVEWPS